MDALSCSGDSMNYKHVRYPNDKSYTPTHVEPDPTTHGWTLRAKNRAGKGENICPGCCKKVRTQETSHGKA